MTSNKPNFTIWIDADACPNMVKEIVYKAALKQGIQVILVANSYMQTPKSPHIKSVQVSKGADVADFYIVENACDKDLVITADIPLADLIVKKGAVAINPRGELYTEQNIRERLSLRDFMHNLRSSGVETGGPAPLGQKDKQAFANAFDRIVTKLSRRGK